VTRVQVEPRLPNREIHLTEEESHLDPTRVRHHTRRAAHHLPEERSRLLLRGVEPGLERLEDLHGQLFHGSGFSVPGGLRIS